MRAGRASPGSRHRHAQDCPQGPCLLPAEADMRRPRRRSGFDPQCMVRPCVARVFVDLADAVLHQCIRPLLGAGCAPGHHGYQRARDLISGQASTGPKGSPVFACAGKTDPPLSSHPLADLGGKLRLSYVIVSSSFCAVRAWRPVPSSRPACADGPRARGRQGWPSHGPCRAR
jgi:hypothetical protein